MFHRTRRKSSSDRLYNANLRVWNMRAESKTLDVVNVTLGKLRRSVRCIAISSDDANGYAGTTTGDMIKLSINYPPDPKESVAHCKPALLGCLAKCGPWKKGKKPDAICYSQGKPWTLGILVTMVIDDEAPQFTDTASIVAINN